MKRAKALAVAAVAAGAVLCAAAVAADDTISDRVETTGAREMPFWAYLYDNGFGHLDSRWVSRDAQIVCANRKVDLPDSQIGGLLQTRGTR